MANPVVHFEIASTDSDKVRKFYADVFGWEVDANNPMNYGMASTKDGDTGIDGGFYQVGDANDKPGLRIYAQVADGEAVLAKVEASGGKRLGPLQEVPGMGIKVAQFLDPEGNMFGLVEPV